MRTLDLKTASLLQEQYTASGDNLSTADAGQPRSLTGPTVKRNNATDEGDYDLRSRGRGGELRRGRGEAGDNSTSRIQN